MDERRYEAGHTTRVAGIGDLCGWVRISKRGERRLDIGRAEAWDKQPIIATRKFEASQLQCWARCAPLTFEDGRHSVSNSGCLFRQISA